MAFIAVARLDEIPRNRGLRVQVDGIDLGLYRTGDRVYAMEDTCPHAGFPLSEGEFRNCVVVCKAHGWPFDVRTGFDPDNPDGFPVPCFAVRIVAGRIHVDLDDRINDPRRRERAQGR